MAALWAAQILSKGRNQMTIKEVCEKFQISADTLRYYERVGAIPEVSRTSGGIRNYTEQDLKWVKNAICLRGAGVPVEMIIEYVKLFQQGDDTYEARCNLLKEAREEVLAARKKYDEALEKLNYKIEKYEEAIQTGVLEWNHEQTVQK
jgi:DNA-binding transcriptional MerR regulator